MVDCQPCFGGFIAGHCCPGSSSNSQCPLNTASRIGVPFYLENGLWLLERHKSHLKQMPHKHYLYLDRLLKLISEGSGPDVFLCVLRATIDKGEKGQVLTALQSRHIQLENDSPQTKMKGQRLFEVSFHRGKLVAIPPPLLSPTLNKLKCSRLRGLLSPAEKHKRNH